SGFSANLDFFFCADLFCGFVILYSVLYDIGNASDGICKKYNPAALNDTFNFSKFFLYGKMYLLSLMKLK
ncbi:MAG: hypothetical protein UZ05_CHB002001543, partial [Chlorobi bacterium OLB5]